MKKNERRFTVKQILEACVAEAKEINKAEGEEMTESQLLGYVCDCWISDARIVGSDEFENTMEMVFKVDGKSWAVNFEQNDGAGYCELIDGLGYDLKRPWPTDRSFTCFEVHEVTKTIKVWEPVLLVGES